MKLLSLVFLTCTAGFLYAAENKYATCVFRAESMHEHFRFCEFSELSLSDAHNKALGKCESAYPGECLLGLTVENGCKGVLLAATVLEGDMPLRKIFISKISTQHNFSMLSARKAALEEGFDSFRYLYSVCTDKSIVEYDQ